MSMFSGLPLRSFGLFRLAFLASSLHQATAATNSTFSQSETPVGFGAPSMRKPGSVSSKVRCMIGDQPGFNRVIELL
jgi:hypothetical protein